MDNFADISRSRPILGDPANRPGRIAFEILLLALAVAAAIAATSALSA